MYFDDFLLDGKTKSPANQAGLFRGRGGEITRRGPSVLRRVLRQQTGYLRS